jgi:hypothetical protein
MQLRHLKILQRAADHRLDEQRRAVREQAEIVTTLEKAITSLDAEVAQERAVTGLGLGASLLLPGWLDNQRRRRTSLEGELSAARAELDRRTQQARDIYLELRAVDHLIDDEKRRVRQDQQRREASFLDFVGERLRRDRLAGGH